MLTELHTNPTQLTGLLAFAIAALACARTAALRRSAVWCGLAAAQAAFFIEVWFGLRHRMHDLADTLLQHHGWYAERGPWQLALIVVVIALAIASVTGWWRWRHRDRSASPALLASMVVLFAFAIEAVSLHRVDAAMYAMVGPVKRIALVWAAGAAIAALSALRVARRGEPQGERRDDRPPARHR